MSALSTTKLLAVEEFSKLPPPPVGHYELHHGEVVLVTPPKHEHKRIERRLRKLLEDMADAAGFVCDSEYAYRPLPESEVWTADVVCIRADRDEAIEQWLLGSPEVTIEVKSPTNTKAELHDKAMTTLAGAGAVEFWIVDPETATVTVHNKLSGVHVYHAGLAVPLPFFGGQRLYIADIFPPKK